nr:putative ankyrin repeat protein [Quercus suber]
MATNKGNSLAIEDANLTAWLLKHGASPNVKCALDLTPLSYAVQDVPFSTVRMLFDYGGDVCHGQILHYAVRRTLPDYLDVLAFVLSKGPPINHLMYQDDASSYNQQRVLALGTPLHEAAELGRLDIVKILISEGAHLLIRDSCGEVPLQRAERGPCTEVIEYLKPLTAIAVPPEKQFTEGREATPWG